MFIPFPFLEWLDFTTKPPAEMFVTYRQWNADHKRQPSQWLPDQAFKNLQHVFFFGNIPFCLFSPSDCYREIGHIITSPWLICNHRSPIIAARISPYIAKYSQHIPCYPHVPNLFGCWFQSLWKIWKSVGMIIHKILENMFQTTNQLSHF